MGKLDSRHNFFWRAASGNCLHFLSSFFLIWCLCFFFPSLSCFLSSLFKVFSRDQSSFFGLGEVKKKLVFEVNHLKVELVVKQVDLEAERQGCQNLEGVLHAQVAKLEKQKEDVLAALKEESEKCDDLKKDFDDI
jgi:hypothetical protein